MGVGMLGTRGDCKVSVGDRGWREILGDVRVRRKGCKGSEGCGEAGKGCERDCGGGMWCDGKHGCGGCGRGVWWQW